MIFEVFSYDSMMTLHVGRNIPSFVLRAVNSAILLSEETDTSRQSVLAGMVQHLKCFLAEVYTAFHLYS